MPDPSDPSGLAARILADLRRAWREMAWTVLAYRAICAIVLLPLGGLVFRGLLALSGKTMVADQDILAFFLGPVGWITVMVLGAGWIAFSVLELVALMVAVRDAGGTARIRARAALLSAARMTWPVLQVTARVVAIGVLIAAPFLAAAGGLFLLLLTEYDINFYLATRPPVFWVAIASIGAVLLTMVVVLIRLLAAYAYFLPLLLLEGTTPAETLRVSRERTAGHRWLLFRWTLAWALASWLLLSVGSAFVGAIGRLLLPLMAGSLPLLTLATGGMLLLWAVVGFVASLVTVAVAALGLMDLYHRMGRPEGSPAPAIEPVASGGMRMSRRALAVGLVLGLAAASAAGAAMLSSIRLEDRTTIMAHRGASLAAPENTLAAVRQAIIDRTDWVEIDVQQTVDDVVIVCHDRDLKKIAGSDLVIGESTAEALRHVDIGSSFSPEFAGERMPTLDEVLRTCRGKAGVNIELKHYGPARGLERLVVERVEALGMQDHIVVMSFDAGAVARMRELRPGWRVGRLAAMALGELKGEDASFLAVGPQLATPRFVRKTQAKGKELYVWAINDPVAMSRYFSMGIDALITDDPALARRVLEQRARMSTVERLLVELAAFFGASPEIEVTAEDA